ncbi:hypothetical protein [Arthrobacter sp. FB24]|uniref:hypothetical protein n=1 Tax=Arthrobacter sp. (strain FB24) TaxID=290399 RepID=UPI001E443251|nr:hypothetical protein [Arthrobacter sp. FB24]
MEHSTNPGYSQPLDQNHRPPERRGPDAGAQGLSPDQHSQRHLHDVADVLELRREHRLQQVMPALIDLLADDSSSGRHLLVLTDASGDPVARGQVYVARL